MKLGELSSFGHNLADSLASGICLMAGIYGVDVFNEASSSQEGHIVVDFLSGTMDGSPASASLKAAVTRFSELLPSLAQRHNLDFDQIKTVRARFGVDQVLGPHFSVTVETVDGRRSVDQYVGIPGRRWGRPRRSREFT